MADGGPSGAREIFGGGPTQGFRRPGGAPSPWAEKLDPVGILWPALRAGGHPPASGRGSRPTRRTNALAEAPGRRPNRRPRPTVPAHAPDCRSHPVRPADVPNRRARPTLPAHTPDRRSRPVLPADAPTYALGTPSRPMLQIAVSGRYSRQTFPVKADAPGSPSRPMLQTAVPIRCSRPTFPPTAEAPGTPAWPMLPARNAGPRIPTGSNFSAQGDGAPSGRRQPWGTTREILLSPRGAAGAIVRRFGIAFPIAAPGPRCGHVADRVRADLQIDSDFAFDGSRRKD